MQTKIRVRERYCAAMSLEDPALDAEANRRKFGQWVEPHGHDFVIEAIATGPVSKRNECVLDFARFHKIIQREIIRRVDHRRLNDLDLFADCAPTYENQARVYYGLIQSALPRAVTLESLSVEDAEGAAAIVSPD